jgi:hypothetical protein
VEEKAVVTREATTRGPRPGWLKGKSGNPRGGSAKHRLEMEIRRALKREGPAGVQRLMDVWIRGAKDCDSVSAFRAIASAVGLGVDAAAGGTRVQLVHQVVIGDRPSGEPAALEIREPPRIEAMAPAVDEIEEVVIEENGHASPLTLPLVDDHT